MNKEDGITEVHVRALIKELETKCLNGYRFYSSPFDVDEIKQKISTPLLTLRFSYSQSENDGIQVAFKCRAWYDNDVLIIGLLQRYSGVATA